MGTYRTKSATIEAAQWPSADAPWPPGVDDRNSCLRQGRECQVNGPHAHGKQGAVMVHPGNWLIKEMDGSGYYPCDSNVSAAKYEPVT